MRCSHFLPTVCLYWAKSHEVHKCQTDSWVTAVRVDAVGKRVSSLELSRMTLVPKLDTWGLIRWNLHDFYNIKYSI